MSRLIELVKEGAPIDAIKADLWDNRNVAGYIDMADEEGCTALMWAIGMNQHPCFELLLEENANINISHAKGETIHSMLKWRFEVANMCWDINKYYQESRDTAFKTLDDVKRFYSILSHHTKKHNYAVINGKRYSLIEAPLDNFLGGLK